MTNRLPSLKANEIIRALEKAGFAVVRISGSHRRLVHQTDTTRATTVPVHNGRDIPRPLLMAILKQARLSPDEFANLL